MVHISEPYNTTLHISVFIIGIFNVLFTFPLRSSLLFENATFPIAVLLLISLWHLALDVATVVSEAEDRLFQAIIADTNHVLRKHFPDR